MAISASKVRSLCTASEYNLFKWSGARMSKTLTPSQLKQKIERARKLRDKYRDLAKQQRGEARGKRKPTGTRPAAGNDRTKEKAELFAEVLDRLQSALKAAGSATSATKKQAKKKASKKSTASTTKKKTPAKKTATGRTKSSARSKASKKSATATATRKTKKTAANAKKKQKKQAPASSAAPTMKKTTAAKADAGTKRTRSPQRGATPPIPLAPAALATNPALGGDEGYESSLGSLGAGSSGSGSEIDARRTRRLRMSRDAKAGRVESRFSRTVQEKMGLQEIVWVIWCRWRDGRRAVVGGRWFFSCPGRAGADCGRAVCCADER